MTAVLEKAIHSVSARVEDSALGDRELLRRFAEKSDQAAFAVLVQRYSGMVLGVCRRSLANVQDAEDACQATFLVLARKAASGRWRPSLANWLYTTARQVASNARVAAQRRARRESQAALPKVVSAAEQMTGRELVAALDEALDSLHARYREPLVLCYLEGLTQDEAAVRLGIPRTTVKTLLQRGRKRLHDSLTQRGCTLGAGMLALTIVSPTRAGASSCLVKTILSTVAGSPARPVAELARGVIVNAFMYRLVRATLAVAVITCLGIGVWSAWPAAGGQLPEKGKPATTGRADVKPKQPAEEEGRTLSGRVVDPAGRPLAKATIVLVDQDANEKRIQKELATTGTDGHFRCIVPPGRKHQGDYRQLVARTRGYAADWISMNEAASSKPIVLRLANASLRVRGRVLTLEGKPVRNALVRVLFVQAPDGKNGLKEMYRKWAVSPNDGAGLLQKRLSYPIAGGLPDKVLTDEQGRFEIAGVGDGRVLSLEFSAESIETVIARVAIDPAFDSRAVRFDPSRVDPGSPYRRTGPPLYGPAFDHTVRACRVIQGRVIDQKTKKPVADVGVTGRLSQGWWELSVFTKTDAAGRYRLTGLPNAMCQLTFGTAKTTPYLWLEKTIEPTTGLEPFTLDMSLVRGTVVTGRVTDRTTGKPIKGGINFATLSGNKHVLDLPGKDIHEMGSMSYHLDADGRFRFVAPPGLGIIGVQAASYDGREKPYPQARIHAGDRMKPYFQSRRGLGDSFLTTGGVIRPLLSYHAYRVIEPAVGAESLTADIQLDPGKAVAGKVVGPDGQPFSGATMAGLSGMFDEPAILSGADFTVQALLEEDVRVVGAIHAGKKLAGTTRVCGNNKEPPILRLTGWGAITGRLVDEEGAPVAGARVRVYFNNQAAAELQRHLTEGAPAITDTAGRFRMDVPFAGVKFDLSLTHKGKYLRGSPQAEGITVKSGETKGLGDIVVKEAE
jgi:RNA polymerase sigma factor (sigma-70 family)